MATGASDAAREAGKVQLERLGRLIREQRSLAEMSLRELAARTNVSNPYLSQIERGLREPSEQVLDAIAQQLELSAEALQEHGARPVNEQDDAAEPAVVTAIREDPQLTARQRRALLEVYDSFTGRAPKRRRRA